MKNKKILTGVIIAITYFGVALLAVLVHPAFFEFLVVMFMLIAAHELSKAIADKFEQPNKIILTIAVLGGYVCYNFAVYFLPRMVKGLELDGLTVFLCFIFVMVIALFTTMLFSKRNDAPNKLLHFKRTMSTVFVLMYPVGILGFMLAITRVGHFGYALALMLTTSSLSDCGAHLVGCSIKGKKLAPQISPSKTISGAIGGLLGGILAASVVFFMGQLKLFGLSPIFGSNALNICFIFILGIVISILTQIGDLMESYVKRVLEVKDLGNILPGHGGIMDRIDGMMISAVFLYIFFAFVGAV